MLDDIIDFTKYILLKSFKDILFYVFLIVAIVFLYEHMTTYRWERYISHGIYKFFLYAFIVVLLFRCYFLIHYYTIREDNDQQPLHTEYAGWDFLGDFWLNIFALHYLEREETGYIAWGSGTLYVISGIILYFL